MSGGNTSALLDILGWFNTSHGLNDVPPIFSSPQQMLRTIDEIQQGSAPWKSISLKYAGHVDANTPAWKTTTYELIVRDTSIVARNILQNKAFDTKFDYTPFKEYNSTGNARFSNGMSGQWAYNTAVRLHLLLLCGNTK